MNIFRKLERFFYRCKLKLNKRDFFDGIKFIENRKLKDVIIDWTYNLERYKGITINNFSNLLKEFKGLTFPVSIKGLDLRLRIRLYIEDANHRHYYMDIYKIDYERLAVYYIGERTQTLDTTFKYEIQSDGILLKKKNLMPLKDGTSQDYDVTFEYGKETIAMLTNGDYKISVSYNESCNSSEKEISKYLFSLIYKEQIDNVFANFVDIIKMFQKCNTEEPYSLSIKLIEEDDILSEIIVREGVVVNYSYTVKHDDVKKCFYKLSLREKVENFISKYSA